MTLHNPNETTVQIGSPTPGVTEISPQPAQNNVGEGYGDREVKMSQNPIVYKAADPSGGGGLGDLLLCDSRLLPERTSTDESTVSTCGCISNSLLCLFVTILALYMGIEFIKRHL